LRSRREAARYGAKRDVLRCRHRRGDREIRITNPERQKRVATLQHR